MKKQTLEQAVKIIGDYRRNNEEVLDIDDLNEIEDCLSELNEGIKQVNECQTNKALQQLEPLLEYDVQWVQDMCRNLIFTAVAPSSWDEIIADEISKHTDSKYTRTQAMCDNGFYQYIAELAYKDIDIDVLMEESNVHILKSFKDSPIIDILSDTIDRLEDNCNIELANECRSLIRLISR